MVALGVRSTVSEPPGRPRPTGGAKYVNDTLPPIVDVNVWVPETGTTWTRLNENGSEIVVLATTPSPFVSVTSTLNAPSCTFVCGIVYRSNAVAPVVGAVT